MVLRGLIGVVMVALGLMFVAVSMKANYLAGQALGETAEQGQAFALLGAAMSGANAGLPFAMAWGWQRRELGVATVAMVLLGLFLTYSLWSAVGFAAGNRGAVVSGREAVIASFDAARRQETDLRRQLEAVATARPPTVVDAEIARFKQDRIWTSSKECVDATAVSSRDYCKRYEGLKGELAAAVEAGRVRGQLERVQGELAALRAKGAERDTDPQTQLVSRWFGVSRTDVATGWSVLFAVLVELGCAFLPFVGLSMLGVRHAPNEVMVKPEAVPARDRLPRTSKRRKMRVLRPSIAPGRETTALPPLHDAEFGNDGALKLHE